MNQEIETEEKKTKTNRVLTELQELVSQGLITKEDVLGFFKQEEKVKIVKESPHHTVRTLYFIGGFIIVLGVGIFIWQFWANWSQGVKVIFALGLTSLLYGIGYYLHYSYPKLLIFSNISFILSALLLPLGVGTFLDLVGTSATTSAALSINFSILFVSYFISYWLLKYDVFLIFTTISASSLFISFTNFLVGGKPTAIFYEYRLLLLGIALFSFGYYFELYKKHLVNIFYFFGLIMLLGSTFALSLDNTFWLFVFPLLLASVFYASTILKNKLILALATIFTFIEIGRLTAEYFSKSLGWPIALIIAGFGIILVGYLSYEVGKKYIKKQTIP